MSLRALGTNVAIVEYAPAISSGECCWLSQPRQAVWEPVVVKRIERSVSDDPVAQRRQTHLVPVVAEAAVHFFNAYSDSLPSEPYIYASADGGLIADFESPVGRFSVSINDNFVQILAPPHTFIPPRTYQLGDPQIRIALGRLQTIERQRAR